jgi:hypothetical protein
LNAKLPADPGVTELEARTEFAEPTATMDDDVGIPVQKPLLKNAYATLPVTPIDGNPPIRVA